MIMDCHTHVWESSEQLGQAAGLWGAAGRGGGRLAGPPKATADDHLAATHPVDVCLVLGLKSHYLKADIPNDYVSGYARRHSDRLIGFAGVDPARPKEAVDELRRAHDQLGMQGATVWPAGQDFHPVCSGAMRVYEQACRLGMPIVFYMDVDAAAAAKMEFARPVLLDEVAREFPNLKMVVAQLGYPWIEETIALLAKHANVFADISGLLQTPWRAYNTLISAYEAGVMESLLFGSNFPFTSAAVCIEALYSINHLCHGTNLPTIPREQLRRIVERDSLESLGLAARNAPGPRERDTTVIHTDD